MTLANSRKSNYPDWYQDVITAADMAETSMSPGSMVVKLRTAGDAKADFLDLDNFVNDVPALLDKVHETLFAQAKEYQAKFTRTDIKDYNAFKAYFGDKNEYLSESKKPVGFVRAPWSGDIEATEPLLKELQVTIRCLPLEQSKDLGACVLTGKPAVVEAVFARAY